MLIPKREALIRDMAARDKAVRQAEKEAAKESGGAKAPELSRAALRGAGIKTGSDAASERDLVAKTGISRTEVQRAKQRASALGEEAVRAINRGPKLHASDALPIAVIRVACSSPRMPRHAPGPVPTLAELLHATPWLWLWLYCTGCPRRRAVALAPYVNLWGGDASSDLLRRRSRCSSCGRTGAVTMLQSYGDALTGIEAFPREAMWPAG